MLIDVDELREGMMISVSILNENKVVVITEGTVLTESDIIRLKLCGISKVNIDLGYHENTQPNLGEKLFHILLSASTNVKSILNVTEHIRALIAELITMDSLNLELSNVFKHNLVTYKHSVNTAFVSTLIGYSMGLNSNELTDLIVGAALHDVGKTFIPNSILDKPGSLNKPEFNIIRSHASLGHELLLKHNIPAPIALMAFEHHENSDGSGYPLGKTEKETSLFGQIIHVADVFDAMVSKRPYKQQKLPTAVLYEIQRNKCKFNPEVIQHLGKTLPYYLSARKDLGV